MLSSMHSWSGGRSLLTFHSLKWLSTPPSSGILLHCYAISMPTCSLCDKLLIFQIGHLSLVPSSKTHDAAVFLADFSTSPVLSIITHQMRIICHLNMRPNILLPHSPTVTCAHSSPMHGVTLLVDSVEVGWQVQHHSHSTHSDDASPHQGLSFILLSNSLFTSSATDFHPTAHCNSSPEILQMQYTDTDAHPILLPVSAPSKVSHTHHCTQSLKWGQEQSFKDSGHSEVVRCAFKEGAGQGQSGLGQGCGRQQMREYTCVLCLDFEYNSFATFLINSEDY